MNAVRRLVSGNRLMALDGVPLRKRFRLFALVAFTFPSRNKVKALIRFGDGMRTAGFNDTAVGVYRLAVLEARRVRTHHLMKTLDKRLEGILNIVRMPN